ncbi:MAG: hypothetical protein ACJ0GC_05650 [Amylibacter sp.]
MRRTTTAPAEMAYKIRFTFGASVCYSPAKWPEILTIEYEEPIAFILMLVTMTNQINDRISAIA